MPARLPTGFSTDTWDVHATQFKAGLSSLVRVTANCIVVSALQGAVIALRIPGSPTTPCIYPADPALFLCFPHADYPHSRRGHRIDCWSAPPIGAAVSEHAQLGSLGLARTPACALSLQCAS